MDKQSKTVKRSGTVTHAIRTADGGYISVRLTRKLAMATFCTECMGWEIDPAECTAVNCPLYPFRVKTLKTKTGDKTHGATAQHWK